jgi:hypothetical protein
MATVLRMGLMALGISNCSGVAITPRSAAPTLFELAPAAARDMPLLSAPVVQNFFGASSLRHDMVSLAAMAWSPYNGNFQNGTFAVDGFPAEVATTQWRACEGLRTGTAGDVAIANAVRMPFESYAFQQLWSLSAADADVHTVTANLDGPFFRFCDVDGQGACGWGTTFPIDRASYSATLVALPSGVTAMVTVDGVTGVACASAIWFHGSGGGENTTVDVGVFAANRTFSLTATFAGGGAVLQQVAAVGNSSAAALALLAGFVGDAAYAAAWSGACDLWENRWQSAFQRPPASLAAGGGGSGTSHFPGNLPLLTSSDPGIDRLYYWAALALVSLERTNYPPRARTFVISQGPSNSLDGSAGEVGRCTHLKPVPMRALSFSAGMRLCRHGWQVRAVAIRRLTDQVPRCAVRLPVFLTHCNPCGHPDPARLHSRLCAAANSSGICLLQRQRCLCSTLIT